MPLIERSALVPYTDAQMFALVDDIASYPQFLPWCHSATVHHRTEIMAEASIEIASMGIHKSFTTRNDLHFPSQIILTLLDGPFNRLEGVWTFTALGNEGCKIALKLDYDYKGGWAHLAFGAVFSHVAASLVEAFVARAHQILKHEKTH